MNLSATIYALRWLVNDTFRQTLSSMVFWIMLGISVWAIVFCSSISVEGGTVKDEGEIYMPSGKEATGPITEPGQLKILFGAFAFTMHRGGLEEVHFIQVFLATWIAGAVGLILTLVWTANFLPEFLQPGAAVVMLAKPIPRWLFLLGKYLGVVLFVALQGLIFFVGTWAAIGARTGIWNNAYLLGWVLLVIQFAVFYGMSVLIAATWRSTIACVIGALLFWTMSFGMNYGRYVALSLPEVAGAQARPLSPLTSGMIDAGYWIFPKPLDFLMMLEDWLKVGEHKTTLSSLPEIQSARAAGHFNPLASLVTSLAFGFFLVGLAGHQLSKNEY